MADWWSAKTNIPQDPDSGKNRRRYPRKKYTTGATYSVLATPKGAGILQDLSEAGARLVVDQLLPIGTMIKLTFILKNDDEEVPITATAKVIWCVSENGIYQVGVQFIE
jgi:hypothetical protein